MSDDAIFSAAMAATTEAWVCMPDVRLVLQPPSADINALLHGTMPERKTELQQAWRECFTGRIEWRPVPIVEQDAG